MKKVIILFDGSHFPVALLDFAKSLNDAQRILLTGIFLPSVDFASVLDYYNYGSLIAPLYVAGYEDDDTAKARNKARFETFCREHNIRYTMHEDITENVVKQLKYESRHADLMLISSTQFYENLGTPVQEEYLNDTMHQAECPVILLPEQLTSPDNIILAYDGSDSSMHAIKQFVYLLPELCELPTLIVHADDSNAKFPFLQLIREYAPQHFSKLSWYMFDADPKKYFNTWIVNRGNPLLVSGSYGRSFWSELFRPNFVSGIIKEHKLPLFIAHL